MDEQLSYEDLDMERCLVKWHREYSVSLCNSSFETLKYEVPIEGLASVKIMLCQSYLYSISEAFRELVRTYYYAQAAYKIEIELREQGQNRLSNYWKFEVKNYYFRSVIPRIISLLDYVAVMINELAKCEIIKNERQVYFDSLRSHLSKRKQKAGWLSIEEIEELNIVFSLIDKDIEEEYKNIFKRYRNTTTHRYFVGIDELTVLCQRRELSKEEQEMLNTQQTHSYGVRGAPDYTYDDLNSTTEKLLRNLDEMLSRLMQLDMMKNIAKRRMEE